MQPVQPPQADDANTSEGQVTSFNLVGGVKMKTAIDRFESKITKVVSGCWLWGGSLDTGGYGRFNINGKTSGAHRLSYEIKNGDIPRGKHILHTCDTPSCVNPDHLFLGTHQDNMADKVKKGRQAKGLNLPQSKLTDDDIPIIRQRLRKKESQQSIAKDYSVTRTIISMIHRKLIWKGVS